MLLTVGSQPQALGAGQGHRPKGKEPSGGRKPAAGETQGSERAQPPVPVAQVPGLCGDKAPWEGVEPGMDPVLPLRPRLTPGPASESAPLPHPIPPCLVTILNMLRLTSFDFDSKSNEAPY